MEGMKTNCNTATLQHMTLMTASETKTPKKLRKNSYTAMKQTYLCSIKTKGTKMQVLIVKIATIKSKKCAH